jgi:tetratricopeptide (TPR) repeat protein
MRRPGRISTIGSAWAVLVACAPTPPPTRSPGSLEPIPVEEIEGPIAPPGAGIEDALELRTAGDYYYRSGEISRAKEFYAACIAVAEGPLWAACVWALGATNVADARQQEVDDLRHEQELGLRPRPRGPRECTPAHERLDSAFPMLRLAHGRHPTLRRALVIAALYEEYGDDVEALRFYERAQTLDADDPELTRTIARLRSHEPRRHAECDPPDCPDLPFGWHHREGEIDVLGSGLEGMSRERAFTCFSSPASFSPDIWSYWQRRCGQASITLRLHFVDDVIVRVTHERAPDPRDCSGSTTF